MAIFRYKALDSSGNELSDTVEAGNKREAITKLRGQGLFPTKLTLVSGGEVPGAEESGASDVKKSGGVILSEKCKMKRGFETMRGSVGIFGESGEMYLTFKTDTSLLPACDDLSINFKDIIEVNLKGLLRRSMVIETKREGELTFRGNVSRIAIVLMMETKNKSGGSDG